MKMMKMLSWKITINFLVLVLGIHNFCWPRNATTYMRVIPHLNIIFGSLTHAAHHGNDISLYYTPQIDFFLCTNSMLQKCYYDLKTKKDIGPLLDLWNNPETSIMIQTDQLFLSSFLILVYKTTCNFLISLSRNRKSEHTRDVLSKIITLYYKIDSLPLEELLYAIELLADEVPYLCEKYELNSEIVWKEWLHKYWWAPPFIIGTILLRLWVQHSTLKRMRVLRETTQSDYDIVISPDVLNQRELRHQ